MAKSNIKSGVKVQGETQVVFLGILLSSDSTNLWLQADLSPLTHIHLKLNWSTKPFLMNEEETDCHFNTSNKHANTTESGSQFPRAYKDLKHTIQLAISLYIFTGNRVADMPKTRRDLKPNYDSSEEAAKPWSHPSFVTFFTNSKTAHSKLAHNTLI